jgi:hypothetical protein
MKDFIFWMKYGSLESNRLRFFDIIKNIFMLFIFIVVFYIWVALSWVRDHSPKIIKPLFIWLVGPKRI